MREDPEVLRRVRAARLFEPADYFRPLGKAEIFPAAPDAPLEVDLGCGDGTFLVDLAGAHPERRFLGIERLFGRALKVARKAARRDLENVKAFRVESAYAVAHLLPRGGVRRLHLLCPDPWPKLKHAGHRLVKPSFCAAVHGVLEPGGEWLFKTDHAVYFAEVRATVAASGLFTELDWPEDAFFYPQTDFERQWLAEGRTIQRLRLGKSDTLATLA